MNQPYVKQYDNNDVLINSIKTICTLESPNRKFHKNVQNIICKDDSVKRIMYYTEL